METHFCKAGLRYSIKVVLQVAVFERLMCRAVAPASVGIGLALVGFMVSFQGERRGGLEKVSIWVMF